MPHIASSKAAAAPVRFRSSLLACAIHCMLAGAAGLAIGSGAALAAEPVADATAREYAIAPGSLSGALAQFAAASGVRVVFDAQVLAGRQSPGLQGRFGAREGLARLLAGTGYEAAALNDGRYAVRPVATAGGASEAGAEAAATLPAVTVTATQSATGTAAEGYREDRVSSVGPWQGRDLQDTPYSITVFSEEFIENLQASSADQVYRVNPTLQQTRSQYENNQPTINLRGFTLWGSYRDGVRDDQYGHGTTMEDTERIEVLNGLSGFIYGPSNVGGLVNYVTKRSTDERLNSVTVSSLGNKAWYLHGDFGGKFDADGRFGYRANVAKQGGDTSIRGQRIERDMYSLVLDAKPRNDLYLQVSAMNMDYDIHGAQARIAATAATRPSVNALRNDISYGPAWTYRHYNTDRYTAHAKWDVNQAVSLRATYLYSTGVRDSEGAPITNTMTSPTTYNQTLSYFYAPGVDSTLSYVYDKSGAVYGDFKFDTGAVGHKVTLGYQYTNNRQDRWTNSASAIALGSSTIDDPQYFDKPEVAPIDRGAKNINWYGGVRRSLVLGDDITFNDRWSALVGVSHVTLSSKTYDKSALTPALSLLFKPIPDLTTYVSYMESLETGGTAADEYQGVAVVNAGQVFAPLTSKQIEIGAKYSWNGMLLSGALFQIDKGLQYYDLRDPTRPVYVQDGRQVHKGVEFTAIGKLTRDLSLMGGFTLLDAKVKQQKQNPLLEGKRPTQVANKMFKARAEYAVPAVPGLSLSASLNAMGANYADSMNTDRLSGYVIYDLGLRYQMKVGQKPMTIRMDVFNVTDKHYWANSSALGAPRTVVLSANYKF
ncbi:TonB-dependent siderophore receptor [Ottowia sp.]|uniref:TonB-dependent siderophore receptor n=1 Tax=Ottowia sp. TaxID=1898956 RepID=UPI0039E63782